MITVLRSSFSVFLHQNYFFLPSTNNREIQRQKARNEVQLFQTLSQWVQRELVISSFFRIVNEFISSRPLWDITMRLGSAFIRLESFIEKRRPLANFCLVGDYKPAKTALLNIEKSKKKQNSKAPTGSADTTTYV